MISVNLNCGVPKSQSNTVTSRDFRKLRQNPNFFLKKLAMIQWESFKDMDDVDEMENYWTQEINNSLDLVAPWKTRTIKPKKYSKTLQ